MPQLKSVIKDVDEDKNTQGEGGGGYLISLPTI